jgi:hypothetical protein
MLLLFLVVLFSRFVEDLVAIPRCMFLVSLFWRWGKVSFKSNEPFRRSCAYKPLSPYRTYICISEYKLNYSPFQILGLKFRRGDNSTYTFTKRGVVYLVSATPPKRLIGFL